MAGLVRPAFDALCEMCEFVRQRQKPAPTSGGRQRIRAVSASDRRRRDNVNGVEAEHRPETSRRERVVARATDSSSKRCSDDSVPAGARNDRTAPRTLLDAYLDSRKVRTFEELKELLISDRIDSRGGKACGFDGVWQLDEAEGAFQPKVAEKAGAKRFRDKKRRKCFACKAVGHLISECPVVDPGREARALDVPETSEVGDFTGRNTDPEDKASRKTRFKEEPALVHRQFGAVFHGRGGRGLGGLERRNFGLLGDLLAGFSAELPDNGIRIAACPLSYTPGERQDKYTGTTAKGSGRLRHRETATAGGGKKFLLSAGRAENTIHKVEPPQPPPGLPEARTGSGD
ncbi:hypothetical protein HPB47_012257 [Ixodes persulcatus]|uniref:Uncharacterized protein n=1 Tax=Ixodes persulcatus TaxID=34615 RepID=A0AC60NU61_IXOPE|nr:hypothetical protein HPB47_012257 [Ixodes persulcatus]